MGRRTASRALLLAVLVPSLTGAAAPTVNPAVVPARAVVIGPVPADSPQPAPRRVPGESPVVETPYAVADGVVRRTLAFGPGGLEQTLDVFTAPGPPVARPTVLLVHGGSWQYGDSTEWADEAVELVRTRGWTAVSLNYRLAPRALWPAAYEDASAALRLLHARAAELSIDPARIGAVGDSAGGHLAALLGEPAADRPAVRSVVTWSGVNDLSGLLQQPSAGGCAGPAPCELDGLAVKVRRDLMACLPVQCPDAYRGGSPAARVTRGHAATLALSSEDEQIDPRQAWVMDGALSRNGVPSRVHVLPGSLHARGFQATAWPRTLRFLAATLTPETTPAYPRPQVTVTLGLPALRTSAVGRPVALAGAVSPGQLGSTVALQVQQAGGGWRTVRLVPLRKAPDRSTFSTTWTPTRPGTTTWRAVWRGGGGLSTTSPRTVRVS